MFIKLSAADRERFGCPEWIEFDLSRLAAREAATIQGETGLTPAELTGALRTRVEVRDGGRWVAVDTEGGSELPDGARLVTDYNAWAAVVWVGLRRAGCEVTFDQASEFDVFGFSAKASNDIPDLGKGGAAPSIPPATSDD